MKHFFIFLLIFFTSFFVRAQSQFTLKGNATNLGGSPATVYRLTPNSTGQAGLITNQYVIDLSTSFSITFDLYFGTDASGADGIAFSINSACSPTLGGGQGLGTDPSTMNPGIIVEFDTYRNGGGGIDDPAAGQEDHIAAYRIDNPADNISTTAARLTAGTAPWQPGSSFSNNAYHTVIISWTYNNASSQTLDISFDGSVRQSHTGDYLSGLFGGVNKQFWSVSGSTGASKNEHRVRYIEPAQSATATCGADGVQFVAPSRGSSYSWSPASYTGDGNNNDTITATPSTTTTYTCTYTNFCSEAGQEVYFVANVTNDLPEGTVSGTTTVCQDDASPNITFTRTAGTLPLTFSYQINGGATQMVSTVGASTTATVAAPTSVSGVYTYSIVAITDGSGSSCTNSSPTGGGSATITVDPGYQSTFTAMDVGSANWCTGESRDVTVTVTNAGCRTWTDAAPDVNIGVKWNGEADYFVRTDAAGLTAGSSATYTLNVTAPAVGADNLTFDVVKELDCWFGNNNGSCGPGNSISTSAGITIEANDTITLTSAPATAAQTVCINNAITLIDYTLSGGATNASDAGLPAGVTGNLLGSVYTLSGTPTAAGSYTYTVTTSGPCTFTTTTGTIDVDGDDAITLTSVSGTDSQAVCTNTAINSIEYTLSGGATGASVSGLPAGVSDNLVGNVYTLSGTPTAAGVYSYTVTTSGPCNSTTASGLITVGLSLTSAAGTDDQDICLTDPIVDIIYALGGSGQTTTVSGLPAGVTDVFAGGVLTISGTPTVSGEYQYTVNTTGGCATESLVGNITVGIGLVTLGTDTQIVCKNAPIVDIDYTIIGGGTPTVSGLPVGVSGSLTGSIFTISGTPTVEGVYDYTVTTSPGCPTQSNLYGRLTIGMGLVSGVGSDTQSVCRTTPITDIVYVYVGGGTPTVSGLPVGVTSSVNGTNDTLTISGSPTTAGGYSYTITTAGGCGTQSTLYGVINVGINLLPPPGGDNQIICKNSPITDISYFIIGSPGSATVIGLPAGLTSSVTNDTLTITGTATEEGRFDYTVTTTGACVPGSTLYGTLVIGAGLATGTGSTEQSVCINTPIVDIQYEVFGGTAQVYGLPPGVNFSLNATNDTLTISGAPTVEGAYDFTMTTAGGTCDPDSSVFFGTITSGAGLLPGTGNTDQLVCKNAPIVDIQYSVFGGMAQVYGLPAGVNFSLNSTNDTLTISGSPTVEGSYEFTMTTAGGTCDPDSSVFFGTITSGAGLLPGTGSASQIVCKNAPINDIQYEVLGGEATVTGLPTGITASLNVSKDTLTISGTSSVEGTFNYTVSTNGGTCDPNSSELYGELIIGAGLISGVGTDTQTVCKNAPIADIQYKILGGVATVTGLPTGIGYVLNGTNDTLTISGTSSVEGTFSYTVSTAGGTCDPNSSELYGELTIGAGLISAAGADTQTVCKNAPIADIQYKILGGVATVTGLPAGIGYILNATNDTLTISGTSAIEGTFSYTVNTVGGTCDPSSSDLYGELTIGAGLISAAGTDTQTVCKNSAIAEIQYKILGGVATVTGLPTGIGYVLNASNDTLSISGIGTVEGRYGYTVNTIGGLCDPNYTELFGVIVIGGGLDTSGIGGSNIQRLCRGTAIDEIYYTIVGGGAEVRGLPDGLVAVFNTTKDTLIIGGTPSVAGVYDYTVSTAIGTCPDSSLFYGKLTLDEATTTLSSVVATENQTLCLGDSINSIRFAVGGIGTGATISNLISGLDTLFTNGFFEVSGVPELAGVNVFTVTPTGGDCPKVSSTFTITVLNPVAQFVADPPEGHIPLAVKFLNVSSNANIFSWSFGDGGMSNAIDTNYVYSKSEDYNVTLIVSSDSLCPDTTSQTIRVYEIIVPNIFSPNGDNVNDYFSVDSKNLSYCNIEIYDRWGTKIFWSEKVGAVWDGYNMVTELNSSEGTYYYIIKVKDVNGFYVEKKGYVTLLR